MDSLGGFMSFTTLLRASLLAFLLSGCSGQFNFQFRNDVFGGTDQNYTNGVVLTYAIPEEEMSEDVAGAFQQIPTWSAWPISSEKTDLTLFTIRQDMFTPDDLSISEIIEDENPYAGTLTLGIRKLIADEKRKISTEIRFGTSGPPSLADKTQTWVHDTLTNLGRHNTHPEGWHNQIKAEPVFNAEHFRQWVWYENSFKRFGLSSYNKWGVRLGTIHTDTQFNHGYMFGYNVPNMSRTNVRDTAGIYLFGEGFGRFSLHNLYYDGGVFRDSPHTVDSTYFVGGIDIGAGIEYDNYSLKFHYVTSSKNYQEQEENFHSVGYLSFGVEW